MSRWFGMAEAGVATTGCSKSMDLDEGSLVDRIDLIS